jgi:hypothetical protein
VARKRRKRRKYMPFVALIGLVMTLGGGVLVVSMFALSDGIKTSHEPVTWGAATMLVGWALQLYFGKPRTH